MADSSIAYFNIRCLIRHPHLKLNLIAKQIGCKPDLFWSIGERVMTPAGKLLDGVRHDTLWSKYFSFIGRTDLFNCVDEAINSLNLCEGFVANMKETGGSFLITVDIFGSNNFGDVVSSYNVKRFVETGFDFGIEVFR
jgi:hypothetical protein